MNEKMLGKIKWFKNHKGYGYIVGYDDETYFFKKEDCLDLNIVVKDNAEVLFIPNFENEVSFATEVEILEK